MNRHRIAPAIFVVAAIALLIGVVVPGLKWGLPSAERNRCALGSDPSKWHAPPMSVEEQRDPWGTYPNYLAGGETRTGGNPRSAYNPIRTYHPDEYAILKSLSGMSPSQLKLFPGFFGWPALQVYVVGGALKVASWVGAVELVPDMDFYFQHPEAMAKLYIVGRIVTLIFALGCIVVLALSAELIFGREAMGPAALILALMPVFAINAHYLTADIPMLFWICLTLLASVHILRGKGVRSYILAGVFLGLAAGTRYQGGLAAFLILFAHLLRPSESKEEDAGIDSDKETHSDSIITRFWGRYLWIAAGVSILVFLATNPYILLKPGQFFSEFVGELRGSRNPQAFLLSSILLVESGLGLMLAFAIMGALVLLIARRDRPVIFVVLGFGVPAVLLFAGRPAMVRYLMPVVPLPALLLAWAFAVVHRQGKTLGKTPAKLATPILLAVVAAATFLHTADYCKLFSDRDSDTRTKAGEWIARCLPTGATVGTLSEPWQFDLPPLDGNRLKIRIVEPSLESLDVAAPDYIVTSDLQFPPIAIRGPLSISEKGFQREVREGGSQYTVLETVEAWPRFRKKILEHGPHDMRYINPKIVIVRRRTPVRSGGVGSP